MDTGNGDVDGLRVEDVDGVEDGVAFRISEKVTGMGRHVLVDMGRMVTILL